MFILRDLLSPLQTAFSDNKLGRERAQWFVYTLPAVIVPFTSSINFESVAKSSDTVRSSAQSSALPYLHGLIDLTLGSAVAVALGFDSGAFD